MNSDEQLTRRFLPIGVLLVCLLFPAELPADEPYHWPLSSPTRVTSTLGEFRGDHLHDGIDFSTLNEDDRRVFAVDTGVVDRVLYDADKYGKTLIIRHPDGRRSWYSHLNRFSDPIRDKLSRAVEKGVDFQPDREISVERGSVIGRAGQTGRGGLHLHFALQTGEKGYINPIGRFQPSLPFNGRPTIQGVRLMPLGTDGWIDGEPNDRRYDEIPRRRIKLWGRIGISVTLWNRHPGTRNRSLPETIRLKHNGKVVLRREFDRISPSDKADEFYRLYDTNHSNLSPTSFTINLTPSELENVWEGLTFYDEDETGQLTIEAESVSGEETSRVISYRVVPPPATFQWFPEQVDDEEDEVLDYAQLTRIKPASSRFLVASLTGRQTALEQYSPPQYKSKGSGPEVSIDHSWALNRLKFLVEIDGTWTGWPSLEITRDTHVVTPSLIQVEPGRFVTWWEPDLNRDGWHHVTVSVQGGDAHDTARSRVYLQALRNGREGAVVSLDGRYSLFHSKKGLSFSSFVQLQERTVHDNPREGLTLIEDPLTIEPSFLQSNRQFVLSAELPDTVASPEHVGLYKYNQVSEQWDFVSNQTGFSERSREGSIHQGGVVGLLRDEAPPAIRSVKRINDELVQVKCHEQGAGIDRRDIAVDIAGHPIDFRWLEGEQIIELEIPAGTSLSSRNLSITVEDRSGRLAEWEGVIENL